MIQLQQNKEYYSKYNPFRCDCDLCQNYYVAITYKYRELTEYLTSIEVDPIKPIEIEFYINETDLTVDYTVKYIVFGKLEEEFPKTLGRVVLRPSSSIQENRIDDQHFIIETHLSQMNWEINTSFDPHVNAVCKMFKETYPEVEIRNEFYYFVIHFSEDVVIIGNSNRLNMVQTSLTMHYKKNQLEDMIADLVHIQNEDYLFVENMKHSKQTFERKPVIMTTDEFYEKERKFKNKKQYRIYTAKRMIQKEDERYRWTIPITIPQGIHFMDV